MQANKWQTRLSRIVGVLAIAAALVPFFHFERSASTPADDSLEWPQAFEGAPLVEQPLLASQRKFLAGFPGEIRLFSDGNRQLICRWVHRPTRKLHPASDCFRAMGYSVDFQAQEISANGVRWGVFLAKRDGEWLEVRERIFDENGNSWTDVSAWFWGVGWGKMQGPWCALTVIKRIQPS